ncbi:MAG TPA: UDP-N-acetylmuramoyl-L-alanine--D-glutamate ligase [Myxococcota bacterium]|nr:UDP-N-acetylmuramoyl-L-alanine--D-glutamate ligase [Myxococcota bacterium]
MRELANQKVLVLGLGLTGLSAANFCSARGARVTAADERGEGELGDLERLDAKVERRLGRPFPDPGDFDLVVPSPGIAPERYRTRARRVWGDIEIAARALSAPIIAVTGTNGKSTTVRLIEAMLVAAGVRARAAGNVGTPALELVGEPLDFAVLEVSSFQLESVEAFRPSIAVILNITPDHLDRHHGFDAYVAAKGRLLANQRETDTAVLHLDDPNVAALAARTRARVFPFRTSGPVEPGAYLDAGAVILAERGAPRLRIPLDAMRLAGAHNRENALAALAAVHVAGVDAMRAASALASFEALPHRSELVAEIRGVRYVNDSKATNPGAAIRSLAGYSEPVIWIAGGRDKHLDFAELADAAQRRVRAAVLIGEAAKKLAGALAGRVETSTSASLEEAVARAAQIARAGEVVLLAPACASQDQFRDFQQRGERFCAAVAELQQRGAP